MLDIFLSSTKALFSIILRKNLKNIHQFIRSVRYVVQDIFNTWPSNSGVPGHEIREDTAKLTNYIVKTVTISYSILMVSILFNSISSYNADPYTDRRYFLQATFPTTYAKRSPFFEILCIYQFIVVIFCLNIHIVMDGFLITLVCDH